MLPWLASDIVCACGDAGSDKHRGPHCATIAGFPSQYVQDSRPATPALHVGHLRAVKESRRRSEGTGGTRRRSWCDRQTRPRASDCKFHAPHKGCLKPTMFSDVLPVRLVLKKHVVVGATGRVVGIGATGRGHVPSPVAQSTTRPVCPNDYVVFNTSLTGNTSLNIVGFNQLYAGAGGILQHWALGLVCYHTKTDAVAPGTFTSPTLSFERHAGGLHGGRGWRDGSPAHTAMEIRRWWHSGGPLCLSLPASPQAQNYVACKATEHLVCSVGFWQRGRQY